APKVVPSKVGDSTLVISILVMRASASCESENAASAAVTASAILVFIAPPLEYCFLASPAPSRPLRPRRRDDDLHHSPLGSVHFAGVPTKLTHSTSLSAACWTRVAQSSPKPAGIGPVHLAPFAAAAVPASR